jgi:GT2 family glycosyltransferase
MRIMKVRLTKPDIFKPLHRRTASALLKKGWAAAADNTYQPNIGVLIRTKNDAGNIPIWFKHIEQARQQYKGRIDVVVVDTDSTDNTLQLAKDFGATIVALRQAEFNYPLSINRGLATLAADIEAAFITVGHALPALSNCLQAAVRHFASSKVVGAYSPIIPNENASRSEGWLFWYTRPLRKPAHLISRIGLGVMGATNCMVRMAAWRKHPFDEAYAMGGEDTAWARWAMQQSYSIMVEPAMTVHHSHRLGPINLWRQQKHWRQIMKPLPFDQTDIHRRRPDLFK